MIVSAILVLIAQPDDAGWVQRQAAYSQWWKCVSGNVGTFAKQAEPADQVVTAAYGLCGSEMTNFALAASKERANETEDAFQARWESKMKPGLLGMVMALRVE